ncbi:hypothetical protein FNO01nite_03160 [Flavobacterium noncentrifugens]|uniref:DNA topoisomerase-1 n=1 Tax=Flavobacterium noncentrifugens TaxID=1128970 RepID=A0A1G8RZL0_9FLAO|nr:hypothetical protein [Flavobacterium noncentrifugens]GEP49644.1 hypothetical protein FNO01nite_03160 [Flavobacterium noncentrifugens]SDJ22408.1 DNA topoisomerase-1 [Flavobacterium noncentrifugens]
MKKLMMLVAVLGLATTMTYAQEAPAKTVKSNKKHKTEVVKTETKTETKAAPAKTETAKKTTTKVETKTKTK